MSVGLGYSIEEKDFVIVSDSMGNIRITQVTGIDKTRRDVEKLLMTESRPPEKPFGTNISSLLGQKYRESVLFTMLRESIADALSNLREAQTKEPSIGEDERLAAIEVYTFSDPDDPTLVRYVLNLTNELGQTSELQHVVGG